VNSQRVAAATALLFAALGIIVQIAAGADYPVVPPGLLIVLAAAAICLWWRRWWALVAAAAVGVFLLVGGALAPNTGINIDAGGGRRWGTVLQLAALVVAVGAAVAGALAERRQALRHQSGN
jgi:hypothetical protein